MKITKNLVRYTVIRNQDSSKVRYTKIILISYLSIHNVGSELISRSLRYKHLLPFEQNSKAFFRLIICKANF